MALRLTNPDLLQSEQGEAAVNDALLRAYRASSKLLRAAQASAQPDPYEIAFMFKPAEAPSNEELKRLVGQLEAASFPAQFRIGLYGAADDNQNDDNELWVSSALDLARYASLAPGNNSVKVLDDRVATDIVRRSYDKSDHETAVLDYEFFNRMGIHNGNMHNLALLASHTIRDGDYAVRCGDLAIEAMPDSPVLHGNRAIVLAMMKRWPEALIGFLEVERLSEDSERTLVVNFYITLTKIECALLGRYDRGLALQAYVKITREQLSSQWSAVLATKHRELERLQGAPQAEGLLS